jgi:hypothetical protein
MDAVALIPAGALPAQPVHIAQTDMAPEQRLLRANHDLPAFGIEAHHITRFPHRQAKAPPLTHREMHDPRMPAERAAFQIDDVAGLGCSRPELGDHVAIAPLGDETYILAVGLVGNGEAELAGYKAHFGLAETS